MRGSVYTLDRAGGELWSQEFEDAEFRVKPIIAESVLIVADRNGLLTGLDLTDGRTVWSQELENAQFDATPLVVGSKVIYVTTRGEIVSVDPVTGAIRRFELGG
jgi:outer membrane protein assembly factor BamB